MVKAMDSDSKFFLKKDFARYSGKWVAIKGQKIIASDANINNAISAAKKKIGTEQFLFAKIPKKNQALIL